MHILISIDIALWCWMAWRDIVSRQVSSFEAGLAGLLGILIAIEGGYLPSAMEAGAILFVAGYLIWLLGFMGGGDVRLLGAAGLTIPLKIVLPLVFAISISGGILSLIYLLAMKSTKSPIFTGPIQSCGLLRVLRAERWRIHRGCPLPYVCAIAAGVIFVLR